MDNVILEIMMTSVQTAEKHCHEMSPKCVKEKRKQ